MYNTFMVRDSWAINKEKWEMKLYECGGRIFTSMEEACSYASFIHKVSLIVLGVFEIKEKWEMTKINISSDKYSEQFTLEQLELIYDALNEYPQWNDDEDDNPTSVVMSKLYNLLENA